MTDRCVWIKDSDLPAGGFFRPGCWNRALNGDDADCHCVDAPETLQEQIDSLKAQIELLKGRRP